jgi:hypothetical protein
MQPGLVSIVVIGAVAGWLAGMALKGRSLGLAGTAPDVGQRRFSGLINEAQERVIAYWSSAVSRACWLRK